jgi:6-phosphogluconate dehydrogenase
MKNKSDIGIYGLGVMGKNITLNLIDKGFLVSVYNRSTNEEVDVVNNFISEINDKRIKGFIDIKNFVLSIKKPRKILIMVKSGLSVDDTICQIVQYTDSEDIVIDGGNSNYLDTEKRIKKYNVRYLGLGISGGWYGALHGPSMMFGGSKSAWFDVQYLFQKISSKGENQITCCNWFGAGGAGHFIKMVHNGIEYAMMQSIAESYDILRKTTAMSNTDISSIFRDWHDGDLNSYLMEISSKSLLVKDGTDYLIDNIIDRSSQKGTGIDFAVCSLKHGVSTPTIIEAINARFISCSKYRENDMPQDECINLHRDYNEITGMLFDSVYCSYIVAIFQGLSLIHKVSEVKLWDIDLVKVMSVWEEGCIIKASIFKELCKYLDKGLVVDILFEELTVQKIENLSKVICFGLGNNIPLPVFTSTLNYHNSISSNKLPANLIQLQREYFGSHGFEKLTHPGELFHLDSEH